MAYQNWVLPESNGNWNWVYYSPVVSGITDGNRVACVQRKNQNVDIDTILITKN